MNEGTKVQYSYVGIFKATFFFAYLHCHLKDEDGKVTLA